MGYSVEQIDTNEESLLEITRFLQETFPQNKKFTPEFVRWQYAQNPLGPMCGFNAWDNGRIVSHFAGLPITMSLHGRVCKGLLCINVSTNVEYRGQKLFTILGLKTIEYAAENGFDFIIAVPNANSTHGFLRHFGFDIISPLTVKVGFGKNIYSNKQFNCYKCWDESQLAWRLKNPANTYYTDEKGVISSPISFFAKTLSKNQVSGSTVNNTLKSVGMRPLNLYIGLGADTSKGLYFNIPSFVKRPPFNLVFRDLTGNIPKINKDDIFLQLIDLDTI